MLTETGKRPFSSVFFTRDHDRSGGGCVIVETFFHATKIISAVQLETRRNCIPEKVINYAGMDRRRSFLLFFYGRNSRCLFPPPTLSVFLSFFAPFWFSLESFPQNLTNVFRISFYIPTRLNPLLSSISLFPFFSICSFFFIPNQLPLFGKLVDRWIRILKP